MGICTQLDCGSTSTARGLCKKHYNKMYWAEVSSIPKDKRIQKFPSRIFLSEEWAAGKKAHQKVVQAAYYKKNRERIKVKQKLIRIRRVYGLSPEQYQQMHKNQKGLCALCGKPPKNKHGLHVDHCHKTGKVRKLLCAGCNNCLHVLERNASWTRKALEYLRQ